MTGEQLFDAITQVDERYIEETADDIQKGKKRGRHWLRWGVIAACFALMLVSPVGGQVIKQLQNIGGQAGGSGNTPASAETYDQEEESNGAAAPEAAGNTEEQDGGIAEDAEEILIDQDTADALFVPEGTVISQGPESNIIYCYSAPKDGEWFFAEPVRAAMEEHEGEEVYYFLAIDMFQREKLLDADSQKVETELSWLRGRGYLVGYADVETENGTETYAAGYFTAEDIKQIVTRGDVGYVFYFRQDEYQQTANGIRLAEPWIPIYDR